MATDRQSDELWSALDRRSNGRVKLPIEAVQSVFLQTFPHWQASIDRRERLRTMIDELATGARVRLPQDLHSGWERAPSPALPRWISLVRESVTQESAFDHRTFPWVNDLAFVAGIRHLRDAKETLQIHTFLKNGGSKRPVVPVKERSFELFGDEKRLDALKSSQLFTPGRLTLDMLRCRNVPATLSCVPGSRDAKQPWLIVENEATFHSFCRLNRIRPLHAGVILGSGNAVLRAIEFLASLLTAPETPRHKDFLYFGDLDRDGIEIPFQLDQRLNKSSGIRVKPAEQYYAWLLEEYRLDAVTNGKTSAALAWFPESLRKNVAAALTQPKPLVQEIVGWELLVRKFTISDEVPF